MNYTAFLIGLIIAICYYFFVIRKERTKYDSKQILDRRREF